MKSILLPAMICSFSVCASGQSPADEAAVRAVVDHWRQGWEAHDPAVMKDDFAPDADWLNAFGVRRKGSAEILAFVATVFKRLTSQNRRTTWDEPKIRLIRPDVALAYRDYKTIGHKTPDGKEMPERKTHCTWVLTKEGGVWRIASQVIGDDVGP